MSLNPSSTVYDIPSARTRAANGGVYVATLTGNITIDATYPAICVLDPGGASRDVTVETPPSDVILIREFVNHADAAENLVIKTATPATVGTVNQNEKGRFLWDGSAWTVIDIVTIALS